LFTCITFSFLFFHNITLTFSCCVCLQKHCQRMIAEVRKRFKPSLFQHVGTQSSLKGKTQKLKVSPGVMQQFYTSLFSVYWLRFAGVLVGIHVHVVGIFTSLEGEANFKTVSLHKVCHIYFAVKASFGWSLWVSLWSRYQGHLH